MPTRRCSFAALVVALWPLTATAQTSTYRLHNESSTTSGFKQLKTAVPDAAATVLQTANLQSTAAGEKAIAEFDTASGVPGVAGKIPSGATITAQVWMRKTASLGVMTPRVKLRLNNASGTALCTATGSTALTTTQTLHTLTCTTSAHVTLTSTSRIYVWAGVNLTSTSSSGAFRGELGLEGTTGGNYESFVTVPNALPAPSISGLTPSTAAIGAVVTIAGTNFRSQQLGSTVRFFNNKTATVTSWSNTSIVATVPAGTTTGAVAVTVAGTASNGSTFTVAPPPSIASLSPTSGAAGTSVTVTGSNFGTTQGTSTVKFNGTTAAVVAWSNAQITATVPAAATSGNVVVTVNGAASNGLTFTVGAATPTLSPGPGSYAAGDLVTITSATAGATIYVTTNGVDPTTADTPIPSGGAVPVGNYTIKAKAYANGYGPSGVAQAAYQRDSTACAYVVRPGALSLGGAATAGQVTITASNDLCDWTASSSQPWLTLGAGSGTGAHSLAVLAAANTTGSVRTATITIGSTVVPVVQNVVSTCTFGAAPNAVAAPSAAGGGSVTVTASDPACAWVAASDASWLSLATTSGVGNGTVDYSHTTNAGPEARWSGTTIANQQISFTQASGTALTIAGGTAPAANAAGWHREDVTVSFSCAGPGTISCAEPVTVTTDGVQDVVGSASNDLSQTASTTVTVRIDRVAPHVAVSFPRANSLVQSGTVTITGSVTDALSTPTVVCGSSLATVSGGAFACTVTVGSGVTNVPIMAIDAAGNQRSTVAVIATTDAIVTQPTNLRVSPQDVTIAVGQRQRFAMLDDLGRAPVDVAWSRTNTPISSVIVTNGQLELTALATGTTTITASWQGLTATSTVTVVSANAFTAGTVLWNAPPISSGATVSSVVKGAPTGDGESFVYAVERGAFDRVRMFTSDGAERVTLDMAGKVVQFSADPVGGAVALVEPNTLVRIDAGGYSYPLVTDVGSPGFAIHPDGALYYAQFSGPNWLRSLDIGQGAGRSVLMSDYANMGLPTVMPDGSVALPYTDETGFRLLLARPNGVDDRYFVIDPQYPVTTSRMPYKAIPDNQGGYFVAYDESGTYGYYAMLARVDSNGVPASTVGNVGGGQHGVWSGSWFPWSSTTTHGQLVMGPISAGNVDTIVATINKFDNGQAGVAVVDLSASGIPYSSWWQATDVQPTYLSSDAGFVGSSPAFGMWGPSPDYDFMALTSPRPLAGVSWVGATTAGLSAMAGPMFSPALVAWGYGQGDGQNSNSARVPRWAHYLPAPEEVVKNEYRRFYDEKRRYRGLGLVRGRHDDLDSMNGKATAASFLVSVADGLDALAFVGHAVTITAGAVGSVGMRFVDKAIVRPNYAAPPQDTIERETLSANARIVFIASCQIGEEFRRLWEYRGRPGRALIYPILLPPASESGVGNVDLLLGTKAWTELMKQLSLGYSASEAVDYVNSKIPEWYPNPNLPDPDPNDGVPPPVDRRHYTRFTVEGLNGGTDVWVDKR